MHRRIQQPLGSFDWKDWLADSAAMIRVEKAFIVWYEAEEKRSSNYLFLSSQKQWIRDAQVLECCLAANAAAAFSAWDLGVLVATPG